MRKIAVLIALLVLISTNGLTENRFSLNGYFKSFSTVFFLPDYSTDGGMLKKPDMGALHCRLHLKLSYNLSEKLSVFASYDFSPRIQDPLLFNEDIFYANIEPLSYRIDDFFARLYPDSSSDVGSFGLYHNLDRFYISIKTKFADFYIGRQAVAWGSARVINPTDIVAPFTFNELDTEERRGVDALRIRIPLGTMDELDVGFISGKGIHLKKSAFFLRGKIHFLKTDLSVLFMGFRQHLLLGLDITRSIGGAGFWFEAAYVKPHFFDQTEIQINDKKSYIRASTGLDYSFSNRTYGFFEYHFNSAGSQNTQDYIANFNSPAFLDGSVYLMGKHYTNIGITYQVTPLIPFTGLLIFNLNDRSLTLSPMFEYNIAENIYISAGAYIGMGKNPEMAVGPLNPSSMPMLRSEFGSYPDMFFFTFRIYF